MFLKFDYPHLLVMVLLVEGNRFEQWV